MAILVHRYDAPGPLRGRHRRPARGADLLPAGPGGQPHHPVVACEKQQVSVLAEHLDQVLDEVLRRSGPAGRRAPGAASKPSDIDPLDAPITEEFRVGTMTIAWDAEINRIVIELFSNVDDEDEARTGRRSRSARGRGRGPGSGRGGRCRRGVRGQDHRRVRPRLRGSRAGAGLRRPPAVPLLPAAAGSRPGTSARGPTATAVRCSEARVPNLPSTSAPNSETC